MPARTFRVRAGAANRDYLRVVRAAEMAAWNSASPSDATLLRAEKIERKSRAEEFAFNVILALALAGVVWGLAGSAPLTSGLQSFVSLVRQLVG